MASIFRKSFHQCFSKITCLPTSFSPPLTLEDDDEDAITNSLSDLQSICSSTHLTMSIIDSSESEASSSLDKSTDFSAIFASQRLIVTSPGRSNSIFDSLSSSSCEQQEKLVRGGVAIKKDSPDPYADFRKSMQEMVEAREKESKIKNHESLESVRDENDYVRNDLLEYLQELLICYLNLNPKSTHKFIIRAFSDLFVSLMSTQSHVSNSENYE